MKSLLETKKRFNAISKGRYVPKRLSPEKAKERLIKMDPGIDLSQTLQALHEGDLKGAGLTLMIEMAATHTLSYFTPVLSEILRALLVSQSEKAPEK